MTDFWKAVLYSVIASATLLVFYKYQDMKLFDRHSELIFLLADDVVDLEFRISDLEKRLEGER